MNILIKKKFLKRFLYKIELRCKLIVVICEFESIKKLIEYLKTENVSYKALNIKHTRVSKPTLYKPEFSKEVEKKREDEILQVLSADSAFQTLTISVDELESEAILIEIASFFKKSISAP